MFSFIIKSKLSPFHLTETLYNFSLAHLNCWHHSLCALGLLLSKTRVTYIHKPCDTLIVNLIIESVTYVIKEGWSGECLQRADAGQRDESSPGWDVPRFHHDTQNGQQLKTYEFFLFLEFSI